MFDFLEEFILTPLVKITVPAVGFFVANWVRKKTRGESRNELNNDFWIVDSITETVVDSLTETVVKGKKAENKWTEKLGRDLKKRAKQEIYDTVGPKVRKTFKKGGEDLGKYVSNLIESKIGGKKQPPK